LRPVPQIGVSRFRIDLGVVHPDRPGDFLAGVECDGASYHSAATARDRDKVREAVLRSLGWQLARVWSTDWWVDRQGALERLDAELGALLVQSRELAAAAPEPAPAPVILISDAARRFGITRVSAAARNRLASAKPVEGHYKE
jgi:hypothetical protein